MGAPRHNGGRLVSQCPPAFTSASVTPHKGRSYLHTAVNDQSPFICVRQFRGLRQRVRHPTATPNLTTILQGVATRKLSDLAGTPGHVRLMLITDRHGP
jgi:hypothetical protein